MKSRVYGWLCLWMLLAATLPIGPFGKQRLAAEHSVLSGQSQHSLDAATKASLQESRVRVEKSYLGLPLSFEANRGQTDAHVKFLSRGQGYTLFLTRRGDAVLALRELGPTADRQKAVEAGTAFKALEFRAAGRAAVVRMHVVGGNPRPEVEGVGELSGKANYFIGKDPTKWRRKVPLFSKVIYRQVYRGVDLVYYGQQRELQHDFVVAPRSDPHSITLRFAGTKGMSLDGSGALILEVQGGQVRFEKPRIYQEVQGARREVPGGYVLKNGHDIGFVAASYDASQPLVIDPMLAYSTYLGGSSYDQGSGIAVDAAGHAYVTGFTASPDFPTTPGAFQSDHHNAFVTALNSDGSALIYSTYLGGSHPDDPYAIAVDSAGNTYVTGLTNSPDFPTTPDAFQSAMPGRQNPFLTALNSDGSGLIYSTYLGGSDLDSGQGIAVDAAGNAYVTGDTYSADFPTTADAFQSAKPGRRSNAFVTALNSDGSGLIYSTYLGGSGIDFGRGGIAVDAAGNAYVAGYTNSTDFPTTPDAFQSAKGGGTLVYNAFVAEFAGFQGKQCAPGGEGECEQTDAGGPAQPPVSPDSHSRSVRLAYSTYFGGSGVGCEDCVDGELALGIAVDAAGNAYVTGREFSPDLPTTPDAFQSAKPGIGNGFVAKIAGFQQCAAQSFASFDVPGGSTLAQSINDSGAIK
jgi:hypothetical protein